MDANHKTRFVMFNEQTRKHEEIDVDEAELLPGQTLVQEFVGITPSGAPAWMTVPGASLYIVTDSLNLALAEEA